MLKIEIIKEVLDKSIGKGSTTAIMRGANSIDTNKKRGKPIVLFINKGQAKNFEGYGLEINKTKKVRTVSIGQIIKIIDDANKKNELLGPILIDNGVLWVACCEAIEKIKKLKK